MKLERLSSTVPIVRQQEEELLALDNAVDRMLASILLVGAHEPSIFLGPIGILLGERGVGTMLIDGRARQPGKGHTRPRGHVETVPEASLVAVSALPSALAVAHALAGGKTLREVGTLGAKAGKPRLLTAMRDRGGQALADKEVLAAFKDSASPLQGGLMSEADVAELQIEARKIDAHTNSTDWPEPGHPLTWEAIATSDGRGRFALAVFGWDPDGVAIGGLEARAPRLAVPVMRGVERTKPGALLDGLPAFHWSADETRVTFEIALPERAVSLTLAR